MKVKRSKLDGPLDDLFSEYIRRKVYHNGRASCERCGHIYYDHTREDGSAYPAWMNLQTAHMCSRVHHNTRWDEENACALCGGCHMYLDREKDKKDEFFIQRLGQARFDLLRARSQETGKIDREAIKIWLKKELELECITTG